MPPLAQGVLLGFSIAAPVGPIGLLCIQRSVNHGRVAGLACGLGAAAADAAYGAVAGFGLTAVSALLLQISTPLHLVGGLFLLYLGLATLRQKPATQAARLASQEPRRLFASTFLLTLTNPMTILSFTAIFAGMGVGSQAAGWRPAFGLTLGVFIGSSLWWCILSTTAAWLGTRLTTVRMRYINVLAGTILIAFSLWQLGSFFRHFNR